MLCDAHAHMGTKEELEERAKHRILTLMCASTPEEAEKLSLLSSDNSWLVPTYGLHPWHAGTYTLSDMRPYLSSCRVIGEIGMDSVWCSTPLDIQERVFREQLQLACDLKKPVILHTKGQEETIASIIREYPNTYLVHWYSCLNYLEEYKKMGCYFSVGPDVIWNPATQAVASGVSGDRLLIETDGLSAVKWAFEQAPVSAQPNSEQEAEKVSSFCTVEASLMKTLFCTAKIRHLSVEDAGKQINSNFINGFLQPDFFSGIPV